MNKAPHKLTQAIPTCLIEYVPGSPLGEYWVSISKDANGSYGEFDTLRSALDFVHDAFVAELEIWEKSSVNGKQAHVKEKG